MTTPEGREATRLPGMRAVFAAELTRALVARRVEQRVIAEAVGIGRSHLSDVRRGYRFPIHETAVALAEVLDWPRLASLSLELRTRACVVCGAPFVDVSHQQTRVYCGHACWSTASKRRERGRRMDRSVVERHRLAAFQEAVDAFCRQCEPDAVCRDAGCRLRPVSPLPMARRDRQELPVLRPTEGFRGPRIVPDRGVSDAKRAYNRDWMRRNRAARAAGGG